MFDSIALLTVVQNKTADTDVDDATVENATVDDATDAAVMLMLFASIPSKHYKH